MTTAFVLSLLALPALLPLSTASAAVPEKILFNRDVRPILSDNCFFCHGPDPKHRKAKLRLDVREEAIAKDAFIPGDAAKSALVERLFTTEPDDLMPPADSHKKLTADQKEILKRWIAQGANYQQHWSYEPPQKAPAPAGRNAVDALVQQRLAELKLQPSPEADKRTLVRRLYSDLLGMPPTPAEVAAFVNDSAPNAYENLVARILKNPHYGERMAMGWLDVVRFADTIGYHSDNGRNVWPYRDWVIQSFNQNKRFDRFTLEQVAGDLLPDASQESRIGSAFNRLLLSTEEGGAQAKDYEARMLTDRVRAIGAAWMGQTTGCAQCHDHKFDPFTTRDFYSLGAFFADIKEPILGKREEGMLVPSKEEAAKLDQLRARAEDAAAQLGRETPQTAEQQRAWEALHTNGPADVAWTPLPPTKLHADRGSKLVDEGAGIVSVSTDGNAASDTYFVTIQTPPGLTTGLKLDALPADALPKSGPGRSNNGNFVLNELTVKDGNTLLKITEATATFEQSGMTAKLAIDGKSNDEKKGWAVLGNTGNENSLYLELEKPVEGGKTLTVLLRQIYGDNHTLGRFRISATSAPAPVRAPNVQIPAAIVKVLKTPTEKRTPDQAKALAKHFRSVAPEFATQRQQVAAAQEALTEFEKSVGHCIVSVSSPQKRTVRILPRGNWMDESGEPIKAALPHYLPKPDTGDRELTRLDLAQWLVSRQNPLTARTVMNRLWKQLFGTGLSKVLDDLGAQGEMPPNHALLDWLACEFMDSGWDFQHMVRLIVSSATYRQTSTASAQLAAADPYNRENARQSAFRMDAELVRDTALTLSGLLAPKIGGPSARPYQPEGYWDNLNFPRRTYANDSGENQYRRGLYTWWQRTFPHPSMTAFDAPSREECCAERNRSNIPQQALVLLNDPTYVEAARSLAARILASGPASADQRIEWAWQQGLQRSPRADELQTLRALFEQHLARYRQDPAAADALLKTGIAPVPAGVDKAELAAWTHIARVLLNLHETITRA